MEDAVFDFLFNALFSGIVEAFIDAEIILRDEMVVVSVGVFVFLAVAQAFGAVVMGIAQVFGHGDGAAGFHFLQRTIDGGISTVALVCRGEVDGGFRNGDARLRPADEFRGLMGGGAEHERHGVCEADVFRSTDHQAARDKARVFAGMNHLGEPVERGVGITAAYAFDECGNGVVMLIAVGIVYDCLFLYAFLSHRHGHLNDAVFAGWRGECCDLHRAQRLAGISIRNRGDMRQGFGSHLHFQVP